jgi:hypothetical protein
MLPLKNELDLNLIGWYGVSVWRKSWVKTYNFASKTIKKWAKKSVF